MKRINIKRIYPSYQDDKYVWVDDEVATFIDEARRQEQAFEKRVSRHQVPYSLDQRYFDHRQILFLSSSPDEYFERKISHQELYEAILFLPPIQARRLHAHFFLNMAVEAIARGEHVSPQAVYSSIGKGLRSLERMLREKSFSKGV